MSLKQVLFKVQPDEVYNLAGQSSVSLSFEQPVETQESVYLGTLNLLEAIRFTVEAMYLMLQQESPEDFVIATGQARKLQDFVATAFDAVGLDWREHTMIDQALFRLTEIMVGQGDASKAAEKLGWKPKYKMDEVVRMMVQAAIEAGE